MLTGCTPWPAEFSEKYRRLGYWQDITLWDVLTNSAKLFSDRVALADGERRFTYARLAELAEKLARRLAACGLRPQERVIFQIHNSAEFVIAFYALLRIGVIPVMALRAHRFNEIMHFADHAGAVAYFGPSQLKDFDYCAMAEEVRASSKDLRQIFVVGKAAPGQISLTELLEAAKAPEAASLPKLDPNEVALMLLSGGTTALPKMIPRTHNDYVLNNREASSLAGFDENTVFLAILPMGHNFTLGCPGVLGTFFRGGRVVLSPAMDVDSVFSLIESEKATVIPLTPPLIVQWLNACAEKRHDISSLQVVQHGGARVLPELRKRLREQWRCASQEIYGTAEGLLCFVRLDDPEDIVLESSGAPMLLGDEIRVVDEEGNDVADGQPGELLARGPYTIRGYFNAPDTNAKSFTEDGFYRMGDVVRKKERYVYTEGRKKELINRGGEKISSEEVENLIIKHPSVSAVCVIALPDPVFGEKACACVIPRPDHQISLKDLNDFLIEQRIAKFKLPERMEVVREFPMSPAGKVLRRKLKEYVEGL
jgi:2,3-dihydroxybenzoate-AMP ligase